MGIRIVLISHGLFAQEAVNTAGLIIGDIAKEVDVISVTADKTYDMCLTELQSLYEMVSGQGQDVLIFTDIYGGTPANIATYLALCNENIQVYSGFNLPVLMELFIARPDTLEAASKVIEQAYAISLVNINSKMKEAEVNGNQVDSY